MLYYALVFLVVGLIAGALGIYGVAAIASQIAWVLFLIGIVLLVIILCPGARSSDRRRLVERPIPHGPQALVLLPCPR